MLAVGRLCAIAIQFTPSAGGPRQGKLVVQDNASNSPQVVILTDRETMIRRACGELLARRAPRHRASFAMRSRGAQEESDRGHSR